MLSCTPGMGDNLGVKVSCGRCPDEPLAEGNCEGVNLAGEEAGEQNLDWMNKNCVEGAGCRMSWKETVKSKKGQSSSV